MCRYTPRQDKDSNGNIGEYEITLFRPTGTGTLEASVVASGTFADDKTVKTVEFECADAEMLSITVLSEAGGRGDWTSAAEFEVLGDVDSFKPI